MTELERCEAEYHKADNAYLELRNTRDRELREAVNEAVARLTSKIHGKYSGGLDDLNSIRLAARAAFESAKLTEANASLPFPVGTKLIGWIRRKLSSFRYGPLEKKSLGVVEVCDKNTEIPKGIVYHRPDIGDVLIRLLKKDGTPGKAVEKYNGDGWRTHIWLPEGEKPKDS